MPKIRFDPDEEVLAELSPSRKSTVFPVLEFVVITGVVWLGVGLVDSYLADLARQWLGYVPESIASVPDLVGEQDAGAATAALWGRRALLVAWVWLSWRRCLRHLLFRSRSRMILTDRRLVTATGHMRSQIGEVPLSHIVDVRHQGSDVRGLPARRRSSAGAARRSVHPEVRETAAIPHPGPPAQNAVLNRYTGQS